MDFATKKHLIHISNASSPSFVSQTFPPIPNQPNYVQNFPIIAIIVVGMLATSLLLIVYYTFVIKCCLNWNHVDLVRVRRISLSSQYEEQSSTNSNVASEPKGLDESMIQSIPVINFKKERDYGERSFCECVVCLNEFQQDEKLRVIPNCNHVFHIDCVDLWLQNNANCPLCRRRISLTRQVEHVLTPRPSPYYQSQNDEDFVVIDLGNNENDEGENMHGRQERGKELMEVQRDSISPSNMKLEHRILHKKEIKLHKVTSMGDECILGINDKDDGFLVQPIRRSFSMDLSIKKSLYQQNLHVDEVSSIDICGDSNSRVKRSFFSFGHGSRSKSVVLPIHLDP